MPDCLLRACPHCRLRWQEATALLLVNNDLPDEEPLRWGLDYPNFAARQIGVKNISLQPERERRRQQALQLRMRTDPASVVAILDAGRQESDQRRGNSHGNGRRTARVKSPGR